MLKLRMGNGWWLVSAFVLGLAGSLGAVRAESVHFTYLWHMEQPIYWPAPQTSGADRYERAWESILRKDAGAAHPENDLRDIFGKADRVAGYQYRTRDSVDAIRWAPEAGAQMSYSGGLVENIFSLGAANQLGYSPNWYQSIREARGWQTNGGKPRMDVVIFPFHHPLLPLIDEATVRKEIQLYKAIYDDAWGASPGLSKGLFPPEMAFSTRLIKPLVEEGLDWVIVSNEHISRACENFPTVLGTGGINCDPPNAADQRNPAQNDWYRVTISRGCSPANAYPYAYTPHRAKYIDPATGVEYAMVVVPAAQAISWEDGYNPIGLGHFNALNANNPPARPQLVLMAHDGDNAWGGGFSYYMEAVPNFVNSANSAGYVATTIEQYLANHPVPGGDIVHVEDGAWVNADGDFGSPAFLNWNWPLVDGAGQIDIPNGWAEDERNWAVITSAQNRVETAEQIAGGVNIDRILYPDGTTTHAERAWHYFLGALNSGYMYYGTALDFEVKPTIACNEAGLHADIVIGDASLDATPPTIWLPQRHPWNPGSLNFGPQYGYQQYIDDGDFWIWTFVDDVSGVADVALKYRVDADDIIDDANMVYGDGSSWQTLAMTKRVFPTGNFHNDPSINFFVTPNDIADEYFVEVTGLRETTIDYYVEATDTKGFVKRSPIQHVYIGDGSGSTGGGGNRVEWTPSPAQAAQPVTIAFDTTGGPLAGAAGVFAHVGFDGWSSVLPSDIAMTYDSVASRWMTTVNVPANVAQVDVAFNNGAGTWDNNNGADWHTQVEGAVSPTWTMDGQLEPDVQVAASNGAVTLSACVLNGVLYVAAPDAGEGRDHFILLAETPGALGSAPWAKAGQVAAWDAFLADENSNDYEGWFDVPGGVATQAATGANGGVLEGTIDLAALYGVVPDEVFLAFAAYGDADGGALAATMQAPASINSDANVDAGEYVAFPTFLRGDTTGDWGIAIDDVPLFVAALLGQTSDATALRAADLNADGILDGRDAQGMVSALLND